MKYNNQMTYSIVNASEENNPGLRKYYFTITNQAWT